MSWKLGIITDEVSQDIGEALQLAREFNLQGVELRSLEDCLVHELPDDRLHQIKDQVLDAGLEICALSTPIFKCELQDEAELKVHRRILERALSVAEMLEVPLLRAFTFWRRGSFDEALPHIVSRLQEVEPIIRSSGKTLVIEPDPSVYASNARLLRQVLEQVNSSSIRALYDPGNHLWDSAQEQPFPFAYEHLIEFISHVHLKDGLRKDGEVNAVAIGRGDVGYEGLLRRLSQDQFSGYLVVETHYRLHRSLGEEELKRPQGSGFSHGGMEASRECLTSLTSLLESL